MPTAKKLPSGSWRCRVFSHTENGKKIYKSFTCSDPSQKGKRQCEAMAADWASSKELQIGAKEAKAPVTLREAMREYVESRKNVLSPRTVSDYGRYMEGYYDGIIDKRIDTVTDRDLQKLINDLSGSRSPKTVANIYGFCHTVLTTYNPKIIYSVDLPKKKKILRRIPSEDEVKRIMKAVEGTNMELPVLLSAFGPMRRGEISALSVEDIDGSVVHVRRNMVKAADNKKDHWVIKSPKSYSGDRYIPFPDFVAAKFPKTDPVVDICPDTITKRFILLLKELEIPSFRFHDLRHFSASFQLANGSDESTVMERGGWGDSRVLRDVYQHVVAEKARKNNEKVNESFKEFE